MTTVAMRPKSKAPRTLIPPTVELDREEIAARAYELFQQRNGTHGHDVEDWLQAEAEIRGRIRLKAPAKGAA